LELTTVGFGAWAAGGGGWEFGWGPQDDDATLGALSKAMDLGINWVDTAAVYGLGHSEEVVGRFIKGMKEKPLIATKCGLPWDDKGKISGNLQKKSMRKEIEGSLARLGVETIDLYQIHWPKPDEDIEEGFDMLASFVYEGKVRSIGVSNFNAAQMERIRLIHPIASLQPPYSMLERGVEDELLGYCGKNKIGVIAYSPMQAGLLTGKFTKERVAALPDDDWRKSKSPHFQEPELTANLEFADGLVTLAEQSGHTAAQLAIAWTLRREELAAAIVGSRSPEQIEGVVPAADWELSDAELKAVDGLLAKRAERLKA